MFRRQQRAQDVVELALDLDVLPAILAEPSESFWIVEIERPSADLVLPPLRGLAIWCISFSPAASLRLASSSASASRPSFAGNPSARAAACVQRWRSSGMSGKPKRGCRMCCSIRGLERIVVRGYDPVRIVRGLKQFRRHRIAGTPQLHRPIVDGVGHAVNPAAGVSSLAMCANDPQVERAEPLNIAVQHVQRHRILPPNLRKIPSSQRACRRLAHRSLARLG